MIGSEEEFVGLTSSEKRHPALRASAQVFMRLVQRLQVFMIAAGFFAASAVQSLMFGQTWKELIPLFIMACSWWLPGVSQRFGGKVETGFIAGHVILSATATALGFGYLPNVPLATSLYAHHRELVPEFLMSIMAMVDFPTMAVLQALRMLAQFSIYTGPMRGDPKTGAIRWVINWFILMALQAFNELRLWWAYKRSLQQPTNTCTATNPEFERDSVNESAMLWDSDEIMCGYAFEHAVAGKVGSAACTPTPAGSAARAASSATASGMQNRLPFVVAEIAPTRNGVMLSKQANVAGRTCISEPDTGLVSGAEAHGLEASQPAARKADCEPDVKLNKGSRQQAQALIQGCAAKPYRRLAKYTTAKLNLKLADLEPEDLPPEWGTAMQQQLRPCMPGAAFQGVTIRRGCVLLSVDLYTPYNNTPNDALVTTPALGALAQATANAFKQCQMADMLRENSLLFVENSGALMSCAWDAAQGAMKPVATAALSDTPHGPEPGVSLSASLLALLQQTRLSDFVGRPRCVVSTMLGAEVYLSFTLLVPDNIRLMGWQPTGPTEGMGQVIRAGSASSATETKSTPYAVKVLARRSGRDYMPVSVTPELTSVKAGFDGKTCVVNAEVCVDMACGEAEGLTFELWVQAMGDSGIPEGPEVMGAQWHVVALSDTWAEAAAELRDTTAGLYKPAAVAAAPVGTHSSEAHFVHDLAAWLGHASGPRNADLTSDDTALMGSIHTGLLLECVRKGSLRLGQLLVATAAQLQPAAAGTAAAWLLRAAGKDAALETGSSLLHAAMASGLPLAVERVVRWVRLYGGQGWRWDWDAVDEMGCTPLHLVAGQTNVSTVTALLEALVRSLTQAEARVAHTAWLQAVGGVRSAPATWFAALHADGADTEKLWTQGVPAADKSDASSSAQPAGVQPAASKEVNSAAAATDAPAPSAGAAGGSSVAAAGQATAAPAAVADAAVPSMWRLVREAWRWSNPSEYEAWAAVALTPIIHFWAHSLVVIGVITYIKSVLEGTPGREVVFIVMHTMPYIAMAISSLGVRGLGTWKRYMFSIPIWHSLGYYYISRLPHANIRTFEATSATGVDWLYMAVIIAPFQQSVMPGVLLGRLAMALCQALAFQQIPEPHPFRRALREQLGAVLITFCVRVWQLRAYYRWRLRTRLAQKRASLDALLPTETDASSSLQDKKVQ